MVDFTDYEIYDQPDIDPDYSHTMDFMVLLSHLIKGKEVVLWVVDVPYANDDDITDSHVQSAITAHVNLHDDKDIWMVTLSTLIGPCFVVHSKNYNADRNDDRTGYVVKTISQWAGEFIPL